VRIPYLVGAAWRGSPLRVDVSVAADHTWRKKQRWIEQRSCIILEGICSQKMQRTVRMERNHVDRAVDAIDQPLSRITINRRGSNSCRRLVRGTPLCVHTLPARGTDRPRCKILGCNRPRLCGPQNLHDGVHFGWCLRCRGARNNRPTEEQEGTRAPEQK